MCWISISRTSAAVTLGLIVSCACLRNFMRRLVECSDCRAARCVDHVAQRLEHRRQIGLELLDRLAEIGDLRPLVAEEQLEQLLQLRRVVDAAAHHLLLVLDQDRFVRVLEDDVVLRIALAEFLLDLLVEVVLLVLGFPIAERHAQRVQQRAVGIDAGLWSASRIRIRDENRGRATCPSP